MIPGMLVVDRLRKGPGCVRWTTKESINGRKPALPWAGSHVARRERHDALIVDSQPLLILSSLDVLLAAPRDTADFRLALQLLGTRLGKIRLRTTPGSQTSEPNSCTFVATDANQRPGLGIHKNVGRARHDPAGNKTCRRDLTMMRECLKKAPRAVLFAAALLSLVVAGGCAVGGSGPCAVNCASITVIGSSNGVSSVNEAPVGVQVTFIATGVNTTLSSVNWSLTGASCSSSDTDPSNPCGYFTSQSTSTTITYQAPSAVPSSASITVTATSGSDSSVQGSAGVTIVDITTTVAPLSVNVGVGLTQEFTAIATPDNAPQTFNWSCTYNSGASNCAHFSQDSTVSGLAYYTASSGETGVQILAMPTADPSSCNTAANCTSAQPTVVTSRVSGTYAFRFSGYDNSSSHSPVFAAGTFTVAGNGSISGVEDEVTSNSFASYSFSGGSYQPTTNNPNSTNNAGTLMLASSAQSYVSQFQVVLDGAGDIQMIESDGNGTGSGVAEPTASNNKFNAGAQTFAFGFTGVDSAQNRVGYSGLLPISGSGGGNSISGGVIDINDGGNTSSICASPCSVSGSYSYNSSTNVGSLTLTAGTVAQNYAFFAANGTAGGNDLTLYAISTDAPANPAVVGTLAIQKSQTYDNKAFHNTSVSALTGAGDNVALVLGATDGTSNGSGGTGNFTGQFDQNNAGTVLASVTFPATGQSPNPYTYVSTNGNTGRYIFYMLGNPAQSQSPIPFVLYASGANRGFLLDQSSSAVMTGTMTPQQAPKGGNFFPATMTGTYAVATNSSSVSSDGSCTGLGHCAVTMNLLLTSPGQSVFNVTGQENPGGQPVNLNYTINLTTGVGTLSPISPATTPNFVIYATTATDFYVIEEDKTVLSPVLFMAQ